MLSSHDKSYARPTYQILDAYLGTRDRRDRDCRSMTITHRFWNVQMKQVMFVGHAVLDALRGRSVGGVSGGGGESAEIDLRQLKRAKAAGAKTLESSMKTNNLRDFMSRSSATVARGCPGPDEGRGHPFVDAMSKYAWAQHAHVVPMESQEQKDERWSNPAEYALLGEGHPRRGTMMIHLRGMARSSTQTRAKGLADRVIADRVGSRGIACDRVGSRGIADRVGSRGIA